MERGEGEVVMRGEGGGWDFERGSIRGGGGGGGDGWEGGGETVTDGEVGWMGGRGERW